ESRQLEVSEFSRQIKLLAKELGIPVVAISQLNRGPEQRNDKKPMVADLRESGSLEQDADMIILLHRKDYYDRESPRLREADLIVARHRTGPTRDIPVVSQGDYAPFRDREHGVATGAASVVGAPPGRELRTEGLGCLDRQRVRRAGPHRDRREAQGAGPVSRL